jgi:insertion element IS1 protein InsB
MERMWQAVCSNRHLPIPEETKALIDKLLLEKIPGAGIARVTGVSRRWLQYYINQKNASVPRQFQVK